MKIGDLVYESTGKEILARVLDTAGRGKIEFNSTGKGKIRDLATTESFVLTAPVPLKGASPVEGKGMIIAEDGEIALFTMHGVGRPKSGGGAIDRGSVVCSTASTSKLSWLDDFFGVFEIEDDVEGNYELKIWTVE